MSSRGKHAVVLGASVAGLLAARALSDHYQHVTLVERDEPSPAPGPRKGVPQGAHSHALLAGGLMALEIMFPGFSAGARERGAMTSGDIGDFGAWYVGGVATLRVHSGVNGLLFSRPALEGYLRELVAKRDNVSFAHGRVARGLLGDARRVVGVSLLERASSSSRPEPRASTPEITLQHLEADLVVDATGRGSQLPRWLRELGAQAPHEQRVRADVHYTSCYVRREPAHFAGDAGFVATPLPPARRGAAVLAVEGGRYLVTLSGYLGEACPADYAGMVEYARGIEPHAVYDFLRRAEPLSLPVQMRDPESCWRRYDRLRSFPDGLLVFGDALCSFNPAYAQGMSVAALEARALMHCLRQSRVSLAARFFRAASAILEAPWSIAVVADFAFEGVTGQRPFGTTLLNAYFRRLHRAAGRDASVALARLRVTHLLAPPATLLAPALLARVLRFGGAASATPLLRAPASGQALPVDLDRARPGAAAPAHE